MAKKAIVRNCTSHLLPRSVCCVLLVLFCLANNLSGQTEPKQKLRSDAEQILTEAEALRTQGTIESLHDAIKKLEESLSLFQAIKERRREAFTLTQLARVSRQLAE